MSGRIGKAQPHNLVYTRAPDKVANGLLWTLFDISDEAVTVYRN